MKVGIYNANLHTMGGGEKYMGVIAEVLARDHEVEILCTQEVDKDKLCQKLDLDFSNVKITALNVENDSEEFSKRSKDYDLFINSTYFSRLKSQCPNSAIVIFFPWIEPHKYPLWLKKLSYDLLRNTIFRNTDRTFIELLNRFYISQVKFFERREYLETYKLFIAISLYTQKWIKKELQIDSKLLYSPVDVDELKPGQKENIIMSVGRFFIHSHNKKQLEMIKFFKELYDTNPAVKPYTFHVCGGVSDAEEDKMYLNKCIKEAEGYPIVIHPNIPIEELRDLYSKAKIFWHATGLNEDINKNPDRFEHFGITTVEAMAAGVVPIVINKAGQVEVVNSGVDGFLWNNLNECKKMTLKVIQDEEFRRKLSQNAVKSSKRFSKENMEREIVKLMAPLLKTN